MTEVELAWLAGLLEGEGCFRIATNSASSSSPGYRWPTIAMNMTDEDVLRRAAQIAAVGKVYGPYGPYKSNPYSKKPFWQWHVTKREDALWLMKRLYPHMGQRRQEKIDEILTEFEEQAV